MPAYSYIALDAHGAEKTGSLEGTDEKQVVAALRQQGLFPTRIEVGGGRPRREIEDTPAAAGTALSRQFALPFSPVASRHELTVFTRQLGTLLRAGVPLLRGLEILARQERNARFRRVQEALGESIKAGSTLSAAMAQHPQVFSRLYVSMIKAGEAGGVLDVVFDRLAHFEEKSLQLRGKIRTAMVYPIVVLGVAAMILVGLLVFVVPKFKQIFADLLKGAPLPPLTQAVLAASEFVKQHALLALGILLLGYVGFRLFRRTATGARVLDALALQLPVFGDLGLKAIVARFARTLGTLLASGVPILQALTITRETCGNVRVADAIAAVHDRVKAGAPIARPMEATGIFPPMVIGMVEVGEHSGQLPEMLNKVADIYEAEVDAAVAGLSSLIEPLMILFLALVVGTIVIALFLPIIRIVQLLG